MEEAFTARQDNIGEEEEKQAAYDEIRKSFAAAVTEFGGKLDEVTEALNTLFGAQAQAAKDHAKAKAGGDRSVSKDVRRCLCLAFPLASRLRRCLCLAARQITSELCDPLLQFDFSGLEEMLTQLNAANEAMIENSITDNAYTDTSANEVVMSYDNVRNSAAKFGGEIEVILSSAEDTRLTEEEMVELQVQPHCPSAAYSCAYLHLCRESLLQLYAVGEWRPLASSCTPRYPRDCELTWCGCAGDVQALRQGQVEVARGERADGGGQGGGRRAVAGGDRGCDQEVRHCLLPCVFQRCRG